MKTRKEKWSRCGPDILANFLSLEKIHSDTFFDDEKCDETNSPWQTAIYYIQIN